MCIISRDPLRAFIAAFNPALRGCVELTIIVDRRWAGSENVAARPAIERRHHPSVDARVKTDGFAIVPLSTTDAPPWIERVVAHRSADDDAEVDERELQRIVEFKRRRKARVGPLVRMSAIVGAFSVLVVLFVQMPAGKSLVNRALLVALPISERTPEPPIETQAASVEEAPVPPRLARPPAERSSRPRDAARTPTEVLSQPPRPQSSDTLESRRRPADPEPAAPARPEWVGEPADAAPTPQRAVTPPAPPRPLIVASAQPTSPPVTAPRPARPTASNPLPPVRPGSLSASALNPTRASEGSSPRTPRTASTSGEAPAHLSSAPRQPSARGLGARIEALKSRVTSDVNTASVEAQRQFDELQSKTLKSLAEMRRIWNNASVFGQ